MMGLNESYGKNYTLRRVTLPEIEKELQNAVEWTRNRLHKTVILELDKEKYKNLLLNLIIDGLHPKLSDGEPDWPYEEVWGFLKDLLSQKIEEEFDKIPRELLRKKSRKN